MGEPVYKDQAMRPSGALGRIMGEIMAATNRPRNRWLIDQLDLAPKLSGLEIGFGNGEALTAFLNQCDDGRALGLDWSQSMIDVATRRNDKAITSGRLRLQLGDATDPMTPLTGPFDRIWCSNVIQMIEDRPALFARLRLLLAPAGLLALCFQPRGDAPPAETLAPLCCGDLTLAGFSDVETRWMPSAKPSAFCIVARP
jgi:cyclopropane fatty-acyl-phospholipid synthase-like methyltransferase